MNVKKKKVRTNTDDNDGPHRGAIARVLGENEGNKRKGEVKRKRRESVKKKAEEN